MLHAGVRLLDFITKHDDILGDKGPLRYLQLQSSVVYSGAQF